ncbi:MAG: alpha/beta hydrolase [Chloroflexi bacterium]|nr:alpha/beta hydrolase [Chloroflexota bacterium]
MKQKEGYAKLTDVRLHYVEQGEGPLVVLLHGFPDFWYSWRHQIPALADAGFRVVAPDMRGHNLSDKPRGVKNYTLDRLATDIVELVGSLGEERVHVVGHDWGGVVAWALAGWHPDLVDRLVILNAPHPDDYRRGLKSPKQLAKSWYTGFFQLPGSPAVLRAGNYAALRKALRSTSTEGAFSDEDLRRYVAAWSEPRAIESQLAYYRAGMKRTFGRTEPLPTVETSVLVIWGERDRSLETLFATPPAELVENVAVELLPEATHWVHMDEPERVNELLLAFLE